MANEQNIKVYERFGLKTLVYIKGVRNIIHNGEGSLTCDDDRSDSRLLDKRPFLIQYRSVQKQNAQFRRID